MVRVRSSRPLPARFAISSSGFRISSSAGASMSAAVTVPAPFFAMCTSTSGDSPSRRATRFLRLRTMSVTSSRTPGSVVNSCAVPSTLTEVTAAPSSDESSTRRSEFPNVWPKPRSSGSMTKTPRCSSTSSWTIFGIWKSITRVAKEIPSLFLLRIQLDDELLLHGRVDLAALGLLQDLAGQAVVVGLEPRRNGGHEIGRVADRLRGRRVRRDGDDVVGANLVARDVHATAVHVEVAVTDELSRLRARGGEPEPVDDVVEPGLEHPQELLAGDARAPRRLLVVRAELLLEQAVVAARLLLLTQLEQVLALLDAPAAVLTRRIRAP